MSIATETLEAPAQIAAALIKAQHSQRERALDIFVCVIIVVLAIMWFRVRFPKPPRNLAPTMDVSGEPEMRTLNWFYTSNFPANRSGLANNPIPSGTRVPSNPSRGADYSPPKLP